MVTSSVRGDPQPKVLNLNEPQGETPMANGSDIIIKGGSVDLNYDESIYQKDSKDPRSHGNKNKKITRVLITGDINYDSEDHPDGVVCDIRISCR
jgi:hypothetical protein